MKRPVRALSVDELAPGQLRRVELDGVAVCVARLGNGDFCAVRDACTHYSIRLSRGDVVGDDIECPAHGSLFSLRTGEVRGLPAYKPLQVFPVALKGDDVIVDLADATPSDDDEDGDDEDDPLDVASRVS